MLRSSFPSISHGLVYINIPGRTCLHELFIKYEQVTAWVARFFSTKRRQIIIYYQPPFALDGSMGRRTNRRHYSLVNFKLLVGRNHWPSCWHGSYGIIYNPPQSPQLSMDAHRVININDIHLLLWSNTENLKPTPRVTLRLGGYNDMTQQTLPVFNEVKNPKTLEGKITRSRRILPYWWKFTSCRKISGSKWRMPF